MGEGALFLTFCQMSRTPARIARMPMPRHAGEGVFSGGGDAQQSAQPHGEGCGEDEGHDAGPDAGEESFDPGVLEQVVDEAAMSRMMKRTEERRPAWRRTPPAPRPATHR